MHEQWVCNESPIWPILGKFPGESENGWDYLDELMREWQVLACVVDADPYINDARRFAKRFRGYVWLTQYRRGKVAREIAVSDEDTGAPMARVDRTNWLGCTMGRFKNNPPRILLPRDVTFEYREHIKNLVRTYKKDETGNMAAEYVNVGADHFAHSLCYADLGLALAPIGGVGENVGKVT